MACMEDFGLAEPECVIVIYTNADSDLKWKHSGGMRDSQLIGMLEVTKAALMKAILE